jgi:hypothetical protein
MSVISINYQDGNTENLGYKSVEVSYNLFKDRKFFESGDFIRDWYYAMKFIIQEMPEGEHLSFSSSVDHFIMDGAPYTSAYLHIEDGVAVLKYLDETDANYIYTQEAVYRGIEFFVAENTQPTWKELKEICVDAKKQE